MTIRQVLQRSFAATASVAVLLAPAIWNRFPLLQYDTGGYLARWFENHLVPSRSPVYGIFLHFLAYPDFWPVLVVQAVVTVWALSLLLRALDLSEQPFLLLGVSCALTAFTALPWLTSVLLTDVFAGLAVIAAYLLIFCDQALRRFERYALVALIAFAAATHSATLAVIIALLAVAALVRWYFSIGTAAGLVRVLAAVAAGSALVVGTNYITARQLRWTPGGLELQFGRMLQDGIVARYLDDHCPDPKLKLCAHRHELPPTANEFFWSGEDSLFDNLGGFPALSDEMSEIVLGCLREYPTMEAETAVAAGARQLFRFDAGEGMVNTIWHTYWAIESFAPAAKSDMRAARQQHGELDFTLVNRINQPVAYASMILLLLAMHLGWRRDGFLDLGRLASTTAVALLANAFVCGVLSNPHDRYGARLIWLAPLVVLLLFCRAYQLHRTAAGDRLNALDAAAS